ncbi:MAG: DUF975 family protein [Flavobacteriaceae bacterium]|nr:DUF975 family protein [Flavobacteriaceae bacterium]
MTKLNSELRAQAREALSDKWGIAIGTFLVYMILLGGIQMAIPIFGGGVTLIISGPMALGISIFTLAIARRENVRLEQLFDGFQNFGTALGAYLLMVVFVFLWTLLLIIPGIIKALAYSQIFYILADDKSVGAKEALEKSEAMMKGYKWKYFLLGFSFIGWFILSILTLGIGFLWLGPYAQVCFAEFYEDIRDNDGIVA